MVTVIEEEDDEEDDTRVDDAEEVEVVEDTTTGKEELVEGEEGPEAGELPGNMTCAVWRNVGGVPDELEPLPTNAERRPCPGARPGGRLLGRARGPADDAAAKAK